MMRRYGPSRGVSSIIAAIFILAALLTFILAFTMIMQRLAQTTSKIAESGEILLKKVGQKLVFNEISVSGNEVNVTVTNEGSEPIILTDYILRNDTLKEYGALSPPVYIPPYQRVKVKIRSLKPLSPQSEYVIVLISSLGNSFKAKYPLPVPPSALPGVKAELLSTYLARTASDGTVTWEGLAPLPIPEVRGGDVVKYEVAAGAAASTPPPYYLNLTDNKVVSVSAEKSLVLVKRSAVFWSDFSSNPFATGELTSLNSTANWVWVRKGYIEQLTSSGGEYIVLAHLLAPVNPSKDSVYLLVKANLSSAPVPLSAGYTDTIFMSSNGFYTLGISNSPAPGAPPGSVASPEIWLYTTIWRRLSGPPPPIPPGTVVPHLNEWYWILSYRSPSGYLVVGEFNSQGSLVTYADALDNTVSPVEFGLGTYDSIAAFDDLVITVNASPIYVNVSGVPAGYEVVIYNSTGLPVASAQAGLNNVASLNVLTQPIIRNGNITVFTPTGRKYVSAVFPVIVGGDEYAVKYAVKLVDYSVVNLSGITKISSVGIGVSASSTLSSTIITVRAYDWRNQAFINVLSGSYSLNTNVTGLPSTLINSSNGTSVLELIAYADAPFTLTIDSLNSFPTVLITQRTHVLIVGEGGTDYIDIYRLLPSSTGNVSVRYWGSIDAHTLFNGEADISFDNYSSNTLLLINSSGIYNVSLVNPASWGVITKAIKATGLGVRLEVAYSPGNGVRLVVMPGEGNNSIYVYTPSTGAVIARDFSSLSLSVSTPYTSSACNGTVFYTILENRSSYSAVLVEFNPFSNVFFIPPKNSTNSMPGINSVGLAYGGGYLWLMLSGGSLYRINPLTAQSNHINVVLLPAPIGYGDRLEYFNNLLILVRASGSSEIWVIPT